MNKRPHAAFRVSAATVLGCCRQRASQHLVIWAFAGINRWLQQLSVQRPVGTLPNVHTPGIANELKP
jgi:hypothetical protein